MILWTIQPDTVFKLIYTRGHYRCNASRVWMLDFARIQYDWLVSQMKKRIGSPPKGVIYPVWAWYRWTLTKKHPDLRGIRWWWGQKGDRFYKHGECVQATFWELKREQVLSFTPFITEGKR